MRIKNFLFHRVSDESDRMWPPMKPALFSRIIKHLTQNYTVVPLEHYLEDPSSFKTTKQIATVLFDDGYKDNIQFAAPILQQHNCPASFYIVTDCINRNIPTWTYILDAVFSQTKKEKIELRYDFVPEKFRALDLQSNGMPNPMIKEVKPWLKQLSNHQRVTILDAICQQCNDAPIPRDKMMNWDDIRQLSKDGFIIGSHSHTHPMLASLSGETEIAEELSVSASTIKKEIGKFPLTISYPIGSFDQRVVDLSVKAGYKYGLAVEQCFYQPGKDDIFKIPRVELYQESWWKTRMRINGMYQRIKKLWR